MVDSKEYLDSTRGLLEVQSKLETKCRLGEKMTCGLNRVIANRIFMFFATSLKSKELFFDSTGVERQNERHEVARSKKDGLQTADEGSLAPSSLSFRRAEGESKTFCFESALHGCR